LGEEFFRQLTAEQLITKVVKGYRKTQWRKMRERNEALETRIYARAAASHFGIDRFQDQHWAALEKQMSIRSSAALPQPQVTTPAQEPSRQERNQGSADPFNRDDRFSRDDRRPWFGNRKGWFDR
jgi:phage terminase large subunit GpA-like protein